MTQIGLSEDFRKGRGTAVPALFLTILRKAQENKESVIVMFFDGEKEFNNVEARLMGIRGRVLNQINDFY